MIAIRLVRRALLLTLLLMVACGGDKDTVGGGGDRASADVGDPCEILGDELLFKHFESAVGKEITRSPSRHSPHPLCTLYWEKPDAAEIEARAQAQMMEYINKKAAGEKPKMPSFKTTNEMSLTLVKPVFASSAQAEANFDRAMKTLSEGVTGSSGDVSITFQADVTPVSGVGDKAMWAQKMHQLSVQDGRRVFHLTVNTGSDSDADTAEAVAGDIIDTGWD